VPPRLLLGGGSVRLLELAGRYADHVDLAPPSHRRGGSEFQRPFLTTVDDLVESAEVVRGGGRHLSISTLLVGVAICDASSVRAEEEALCNRVGLPWRRLDECPYVLVGEPARIAQQLRERQARIGLDWVIVPEIAFEQLAADVLALL
jgi:alkanesulfonate monooxygenase SsuD/methylene tetrahydromethanopterin reductase-like flavin-dependent oxidoreductase (luciferase family)